MNHYEVAIKEPSEEQHTLTYTMSNEQPISKIFVVCDQSDTAPVWGYILRQQGLSVSLETSFEKAVDRWSTEISDLVVIDVDISHEKRLELYRQFRAVSVAPILMFLPAYHETQILAAYEVGVDDVVIKPVSPAVFLAKIRAWTRRSWTVSVEGLNLVKAGKHRLDPARRSLLSPDGREAKLTNLEFRLLHLLMSQPGHVFPAEDIVQSIWGGYDNGDQVLLKNVVYRLRRKIESDPGNPVLVQTGPGGYCFRE
jgi:DNA-binding response OmpR family regulator